MNAGARERADGGAASPLEGYYRLHSRIYDATRWSFLFGRTAILREVAAVAQPGRILEVGCGTGRNLVNLSRFFPEAKIQGIDLSAAMLEVARGKVKHLGQRVRLIHGAYGDDLEGGYDLILFSYALTMFNPGFAEAIATARRQLVRGGHVAVADFHDTCLPVFERWMGVNHVRMNGHLRPLLTAQFSARTDRLCRAYGGVWRYLMFVGRKPA
jgi:S-adenosylmethionine-diacylgycerolhomoserine-N-methlytransferase